MGTNRPDRTPEVVTMRLQRFLARAGVASRRGSEDLMTAGRVKVNGEVVTELGSKVHPINDIVSVDDKVIKWGSTHTYIVLNKPAGYLTTMSDPHGRPTVAELVPIDEYPGLFPVGRLDMDTTGILLFMTDGDLSQALLKPSHDIEKTYHARVQGSVKDAELDPLRKGIELDDGPCKPAKVRILEKGETPLLEITISEGRKRQVKRMCSKIHHNVLELERVAFGPVTKAPEIGTWRHLSDEEIMALRRCTELFLLKTL